VRGEKPKQTKIERRETKKSEILSRCQSCLIQHCIRKHPVYKTNINTVQDLFVSGNLIRSKIQHTINNSLIF